MLYVDGELSAAQDDKCTPAVILSRREEPRSANHGGEGPSPEPISGRPHAGRSFAAMLYVDGELSAAQDDKCTPAVILSRREEPRSANHGGEGPSPEPISGRPHAGRSFAAMLYVDGELSAAQDDKCTPAVILSRREEPRSANHGGEGPSPEPISGRPHAGRSFAAMLYVDGELSAAQDDKCTPAVILSRREEPRSANHGGEGPSPEPISGRPHAGRSFAAMLYVDGELSAAQDDKCTPAVILSRREEPRSANHGGEGPSPEPISGRPHAGRSFAAMLYVDGELSAAQDDKCTPAVILSRREEPRSANHGGEGPSPEPISGRPHAGRSFAAMLYVDGELSAAQDDKCTPAVILSRREEPRIANHGGEGPSPEPISGRPPTGRSFAAMLYVDSELSAAQDDKCTPAVILSRREEPQSANHGGEGPSPEPISGRPQRGKVLRRHALCRWRALCGSG